MSALPTGTCRECGYSVYSDHIMADRTGEELCVYCERQYVRNRSDKRPHCPDCGKLGERKGHMDCQYPEN